MITYWFYLTILMAMIIPVIFLIRRNPDISFWLFLNIFFDPGGYLTYYFEGNVLSVLNISDLIIFLIIFCLYSIKANFKIIYKDHFLLSFSKVFIIFALYYFIVYGAIAPFLNNDLNYLLFLQKNRYFIYYIIIFIAVYFFTLRGLKYFYLTTLFIGSIILLFYLISLTTDIEIIPIWTLERYEGSEMMRLSIYSYGLFYILFPLSLILFLLSNKIKLNINFKKLLYTAGILMLFTLLITLTRRNFISIPGTILIIILINTYVLRKSTVFSFAKLLIPLAAALIIINFTLPKYIDYVASITQDTFLLLTGNADTQGEKDYRVSGRGDLDITKKYISDNFLIGTGYSYLHWDGHEAVSPRGSIYAYAMDAAGEVPVYYIFFGYGLVGFIIMLSLYIFLIRLFLKLYANTRKNLFILIEHPYEALFIVFILYNIVMKFTFSLYSLGQDFSNVSYGIFIAMGFALLQKLKRLNENPQETVLNENQKILTQEIIYET